MKSLNYKALLIQAKHHGQPVAPRGLATRQLEPLEFQVPVGHLVGRKSFNLPLAAAEGLNLMREYTDVELIRSVAPKTTENFYDTNDMSFYGERMRIQRLLRLLYQDPYTRKAYCSLVTNEDADRSTRCIAVVQFHQMHQGELDVHVHLRSWDLFLGLPYDVGMIQFVSVYLARALGLGRGTAYFHASLPHLYESHVSRVEYCEPYWYRIPDIGIPSHQSWNLYCENLHDLIKGGHFKNVDRD